GSTPRPAPVPPLPVAPGTLPSPSTDPDALRAPTMTSAEDSGGYLAPVLSGTAIDGARVALQVDDDVYEIEPDAEGAWSFDLSDLALPYGDHLARAWQHSDTSTSAATEISFTVNAPVLDGFLLLGSLDAALAKDTGIVFTVAGPAGGVVPLRGDTGQRADPAGRFGIGRASGAVPDGGAVRPRRRDLRCRASRPSHDLADRHPE